MTFTTAWSLGFFFWKEAFIQEKENSIARSSMSCFYIIMAHTAYHITVFNNSRPLLLQSVIAITCSMV